MLVVTRKDLAAELAAYGEHEASAKIAALSEAQLHRVYEIGHDHALSGMLLARASCLAAIEVLEGKPRELRRERRVWRDVPPELNQPDPIQLEIRRWFDEYGGGAAVDPRQIFEELASSLTPVLSGFRYFKSHHQFRAVFPDGISSVGIGRGHGVVALRFGVMHAPIESLRQRLFEGVGKPSPRYARTISKYSVNMGPKSPHWPYPTRPQWPVSGADGLRRACAEVAAFVSNVALPYVLDHRDPLRIRNTLLHHPGKADRVDDTAIAQTIFAIDHLSRRRDWLELDYATLRDRYKTYVSPYPEHLDRDMAASVRSWDVVL